MFRLILFILFLPTLLFAQSEILDNTFGSDGAVFTEFDDDFAEEYKSHVYDITTQVDGKIVAVGTAGQSSFYSYFTVARYLNNGLLDEDFGENGMVITSFVEDDYARSVVMQPNGKIFVAGHSWGGPDMFSLCRYNQNGTLDLDFDGDGKLQVDFNTDYQACSQALIDGSNRLLVCGTAGNSFAIFRTLNDGTLDFNFGNEGKVVTSFNENSSATCMALLPDNRIIVAGTTSVGLAKAIAIAVYNENGTLDEAFGDGGKLIVTVDGASFESSPLFGPDAVGVNSILLQNEGGFVVSACKYANDDYMIGLYKFHEDGSFDNSFGVQGEVNIDFDEYLAFSPASTVMQVDGKFLICGNARDDEFDTFIVMVRLNVDGTLDDTFSNNGYAATNIGVDFEGYSEGISALAVQPDNKILVAGEGYETMEEYLADFLVLRYLSGLEVGLENQSVGFSEIEVYPIPLQGTATLEFKNQMQGTIEIKLFNSIGQPVLNVDDANIYPLGHFRKSISLPTDLADGIYFFEIGSKSECIRIKVVK